MGAEQLSADHISAWSSLQRADSTLANPFFRPEFTQAVQAVRGGVEVVVWEQGGEPVGFLPFQRTGWQIGVAVGSPMNDFHGAIVRRDVEWSPQDVIRAAGLRSWQFDHLLASQTAFAPFQYVLSESPYVELSQGYQHYLGTRSKNFRKYIKRAERKANDLGEIRFEIDSADASAFKKLVEWKIDKCRRTQVPCTFARDWSVKLFEFILEHSTEDFSGMLFGVYVGGQLAAVEFCIRSGHVLHEWLSSYNCELSQCSPGAILENRIGEVANSLGITRIDMGKGDEPYKERYASNCIALAEGAVHLRPLGAALSRVWSVTKDRLRSTPLRGPVRRVRRWTLSTRSWLGLEQV